MDSAIHVECKSLLPEDLEILFELCWHDSVQFSAPNRKLSCLDNDNLSAHIDIKQFIKQFFMGQKIQIYYPVTFADVEKYSYLQALDILFRSGSLAGCENWVINRINSLINSRRCFIIASIHGFTKVVDCFLEVHSREWFGPLWEWVAYRGATIENTSSYMISPDLSAKKIDNSYFIHNGSNQWNRAWLPTTLWDNKWQVHYNNWCGMINNCKKLAQKLKSENYLFLFVPEKDTLVRVQSPSMFQSGFLPVLQIQKLSAVIPENRVLFPVTELICQDEGVDFGGGDSHYSANEYWTIFCLILKKFGIKKLLKANVETTDTNLTGDLGGKFNLEPTKRKIFADSIPPAKLASGSSELKLPLRKNYVHFENKKAPIKKSLLILGDSHASIGFNPFLTYIASLYFSHVEFFWNPFCVHPVSSSKLALKSYDYILFETSQRFATPTVSS